MTTPYLSIVIPLYNKEKQIKRAIESVFQQEFTDWELIVINDGSTDKSPEIVASIDDNRVRLINQSNKGVSTARNRGMEEAKGEYVTFLDADDCFQLGAFNLLQEAPKVDMIIGSFIQTDEERNITATKCNKVDGLIKDVYKSYWKREFHIRMGNFFIKNEFLIKKGRLRTDMTLYEDKEWIFRVLDDAKIYTSTSIVLDYNRGLTGLSHGFKPIEKDYAYTASVKHIKNGYKRRMIGDFVFRRLISRLKRHDWHGVKCIWQNNSWNLMFCLFSCVIGYYRDHRNNKFETQLIENGNQAV